MPPPQLFEQQSPFVQHVPPEVLGGAAWHWCIVVSHCPLQQSPSPQHPPPIPAGASAHWFMVHVCEQHSPLLSQK
jgi:hypothetical protein